MPDSPRDVFASDMDFPRTSGQFTGWLGIAFGLLGVVYGVGYADGLDRLRWVTGSVLLALFIYLVMLRPVIRIRADHLELVNPLSTVAIPLPLVADAYVRTISYVTVWPDNQRYSSVAIGRTRRDLVKMPAGVKPGFMGGGPDLGEWGREAQKQTSPRDSVPKLFEETVLNLASQAKGRRDDPDLSVRRTWAIGLAAPAAVLAVAFVVLLLI